MEKNTEKDLFDENSDEEKLEKEMVGMTEKERKEHLKYREEMIKKRRELDESEAERKGITVEELNKRKKEVAKKETRKREEKMREHQEREKIRKEKLDGQTRESIKNMEERRVKELQEELFKTWRKEDEEKWAKELGITVEELRKKKEEWRNRDEKVKKAGGETRKKADEWQRIIEEELEKRENNSYIILGIPEDASKEEVRKAYRSLAMKYHPDRNPGDKEAGAKFREVQEAYDFLME